MKNRLLLCLLIVCTLFCGCKKESTAPNDTLTVELLDHTELLRTSVTLNGHFTSLNEQAVTSYGFIIGSSVNIDESPLKEIEVLENTDGSFTTLVTGLEIGETYYYVAYASNGLYEVTSQVSTFTTALKSGALLTTPIISDSEQITATSTVVDNGGSDITIAGFCYSTTDSLPSINDNFVKCSQISTTFSAVLNLGGLTKYYIRAFAENETTADAQTFSYSKTVEYTTEASVPGSVIDIPDTNFKAYLISKFDANNDDEISITEAQGITMINVMSQKIVSLQGIEYMINLTELDCGVNQLTTLDLSKNTQLEYLYCYDNQLTTLDVSANTQLMTLSCGSNQLTSLNVSGCAQLSKLYLNYNQLTSLDLSGCVQLTYLSCPGNQLTSLELSMNTDLQQLSSGSNQLTSLDVSKNTQLMTLSCGSNQLTSLDLSTNTQLMTLSCGSNQLTSLDLSTNTQLEYLYCYDNQLTSLDVANNKQLTILKCEKNSFVYVTVWEGFDVDDIGATYDDGTLFVVGEYNP